MIPCVLVVVMLAGIPTRLKAQDSSTVAAPPSSGDFWRRVAFGAGISLLAHESAHLLTSVALGFRPHIAFDHARPTVFSGIDSNKYPHKQFIFSAAGLVAQALLDEALLDIPHSRGGATERGILAGGIGTALFYVTLGRNGSVSDISVMARTSSLSKTQLSLIVGGLNAIHALRISRDSSYRHFFVSPAGNELRVGLKY